MARAKLRRLAPLAAAILLAGSPAAAQPAADLQARITRYEGLVRETGDAGVQWLLAETYAQAGRGPDAVATLKALAARRMGFVPDGLSPLNALAGDPAYDAVVSKMRREAPTARRARTAFVIDRPGLVPEGLVYHAASRRLFVGDMHGRAVLAVDAKGAVTTFVPSLALQPLGMKTRGDRLWVVTTNGFTDAGSKRAELAAFDLATGRPVGAWTHPEAASFNDFDFAPNGDVIVSDSLGGVLFRLSGDRMERVTAAGLLGYPNGVAVTDDGAHAFVAQGVSLRRVDLATGDVARVENPPGLSALGIDGLYWRGGKLLAVQNAGTPGRVVELELSPELDRINAFRLLEAGNPTFDVPTTAALAPGCLYVIANAQIDRLRPDGSLDPAKPLRPIHILEIPLG